ncbi:hypothetical protein T4D_16271 [Trichinella pseudospiralis]|uniref:Uncharacterized protein n=1 Tax=Trichinella pseudospiralis TaxID=6337 RepID=A0A0V1F8X9_TRIPS|nr:hypothetical protein T4D_16271 [Trichinella pseudospiralis]
MRTHQEVLLETGIGLCEISYPSIRGAQHWRLWKESMQENYSNKDTGKRLTTEFKCIHFLLLNTLALGTYGQKLICNYLLDTIANWSPLRQDVADELRLSGEVTQ